MKRTMITMGCPRGLDTGSGRLRFGGVDRRRTPAQKAPRAARQRSSWGRRTTTRTRSSPRFTPRPWKMRGTRWTDRCGSVSARSTCPRSRPAQSTCSPSTRATCCQYLDQNATARSTDEVYDALTILLPQGLRALDQAPATDQDSYVVTTTFATEHSLSSIGDLAGAGPLTLGGNSELETRPYGPAGLAQTYGVLVNFTPIEDSGGPLTVKALTDGDIQLANIYSSDPVLADGSLTVLEDPQGLFLASHVVPLASSRVDDKAAGVINRVSAALEPSDLVKMNRASTQDQESASQIAREWLTSKGLLS